MLVSVVVPVWNQVIFTKNCLETLVKDPLRPDYQIIVVDNGSTDETPSFLKSFVPPSGWRSGDSFQVIRNDTNRGVAPAWNQGCSLAKGEALAILNNDILLSSGWFQGCWDVLNKRSLGMVSPYAATGEQWSLPHDLSGPEGQRAWLGFLDRARRFTVRNRRGFWPLYDFCCVVMPLRTWNAMGTFDENYLVGGYEDTDYAYRLRQAGLSYGVTGASYIHHYGSQTLGEFKKRGDRHAAHNKSYFIQKWGQDPSLYGASWRGRLERRWRQLKLRLGYM